MKYWPILSDNDTVGAHKIRQYEVILAIEMSDVHISQAAIGNIYSLLSIPNYWPTTKPISQVHTKMLHS